MWPLSSHRTSLRLLTKERSSQNSACIIIKWIYPVSTAAVRYCFFPWGGSDRPRQLEEGADKQSWNRGNCTIVGVSTSYYIYISGNGVDYLRIFVVIILILQTQIEGRKFKSGKILTLFPALHSVFLRIVLAEFWQIIIYLGLRQ